MKKILALVLFTAMLFALAIPVLADDVQLYAPNATINVDGIKDDGYGDPVNIAAYRDGFEGGATGQVWTAWDADYLYFYIEVNDKTPQHEHGNSWERDCVEIFIDWDNNRGDANSNDDKPYWQIRVTSAPNEDGDQLFNTRNGSGNDDDLLDATKYFAGPKDGDYANGYIIEVAAPYKIAAESGTPALAVGRSIYVDFQIADNFDGSQRDSQAFLTSDDADDQYSHPDACHGLLNLIAAKAPEVVEPDEPEVVDNADDTPVNITPPSSGGSVQTGDNGLMLLVLVIALAGAVVTVKRVGKNKA